MQRASGILLHIASLPSPYGIGQMGKEAYDFVDFLARAGQSYWQVLPLVPTGYGDSPYQSCCSSAGNEYFIDFGDLESRGLLTGAELVSQKTELSSRVDYENLFFSVTKLLRKAFARFDKTDYQFKQFLDTGAFSDYALFRAIKEHFGHKAWSEWPQTYRFGDRPVLGGFREEHADDILFWQWCQFTFWQQWTKLKKYANDKDIKIIGDMPIYVAYDSVECWRHPELLQLDENLIPTAVAGCPPDYFSEDGQLWGNPVYNWERIKADGYKWWIDRLNKCLGVFDVVRIDHFRGFDRYFSIPYGSESAKAGEWKQGPSAEMFEIIEKTTGKMPVIAEDLGILDDSARAMFMKVGYPGMKILQYAFDNPANDYLPHNYTTENCIVYPGTHDNDTLKGFVGSMSWDAKNALQGAVYAEYRTLGLDTFINNDDDLCCEIIRLGYVSKANLVVVQMQDFLGIGREGRINEPSTISTANWSYRIPADYDSEGLAESIKALTEKTGRISRA